MSIRHWCERAAKRSVAALLLMLGAGLSAYGADAPATNPAKPYPLKTCVVSGEELGKMGEAKVIQYEGREVRFCCSDCEKDFRADPAKYLKKLDAAAKATEPGK